MEIAAFLPSQSPQATSHKTSLTLLLQTEQTAFFPNLCSIQIRFRLPLPQPASTIIELSSSFVGEEAGSSCSHGRRGPYVKTVLPKRVDIIDGGMVECC